MNEQSRFPFDVTPKTRVTMSLAAIVVLLVATWRVSNLLNTISNQLGDMRKDIAIASSERWRVDDMERWCYAFDKLNAGKGVTAPNVRDPQIRVHEKNGS